MAVETAATRVGRPSAVTALWRSNIGKKAVMATTGLLMLLFLIVHMLGNLKIFFGRTDFDDYAAWLRTIGHPVLHNAWYLWIQRFGLLVIVGLHAVTAYQLSRRDLQARPAKYAHRLRPTASYATNTMRFGGIILGLFIIYHILDLTALVANPNGAEGKPYDNVVADFSPSHWYIAVAYIVAMLALCAHIAHGFWSAARTLGAVSSATQATTYKAIAGVLAAVITLGFLSVPIAVLAGLVR
ncbi:succinate dehydrogenase cytochrome b subunit [Pseudofrankia sp. DC12]|uniref:succinate dehydrogenase cytochrome b subunit n=1 Tax=Pseudofrankia sp. DC12 TaxID=683315 RepID=UPI0009FC9626|nr:succinate dehydrogenase cytochrome b subunit [Pseudofrankia sp. DC12]